MEEEITTTNSPTNSHQNVVSEDEEVDYWVKPEFYDPKSDFKDELWAHNERKGLSSDAILSCPACFTTLTLASQRHEKYVTQFRAVFVVNCKVTGERLLQQIAPKSKPGKRRIKSNRSEANESENESVKIVCCEVCSTEVGVMDKEEVYHFFNVTPSET